MDVNTTMRRWGKDSRLDNLIRWQCRLNELGRARVNADGRLRDCDGERQRLFCANDPDYLVCENFLDTMTCDALCSAFRDLSTRIVNRIPGFWDSRFLWHLDFAESYSGLVEHMRNAQCSAAELIGDFYRLTQPIYPDLLQVMSWPVGLHMPPHADNANPDGSPHAMAHRDFSGIVYLNDDYEGGELYFTALDTVIKPEQGRAGHVRRVYRGVSSRARGVAGGRKSALHDAILFHLRPEPGGPVTLISPLKPAICSSSRASLNGIGAGRREIALRSNLGRS
jgi:hypothetical protein